MTTKTTISTKGLEEYLEKISLAGKDIDDAADKALLTSAEIIQEEMQGLAPIFTGNLVDHIKIKGPERDGSYHYVDVGVIHDLAYTDANTARYANAQEYGSSKMAAHPYIRPGMDRSRRAAVKAMKDSLEEDGLL